MTLIASSPITTLSPKANYDDDIDDIDHQSLSSNDADDRMQRYSPSPIPLVQSLGFPTGKGGETPAQYGQVNIEHSSDVHFGDKNIYQGPVTIRQIVYANGSPTLASDRREGKCIRDNFGYDASDGELRKDGVCIDLKKASDKTEDCYLGDATGDGQAGGGGATNFPVLRKGLTWLQTFSKHHPVNIGLLVVFLILLLAGLLLFLLLRHPTNKGIAIFDTNEQDKVAPLGYTPDISDAGQINNKLKMVSRLEWVAQPPNNVTTPLVTPVPYVIIHHTATENCSSTAQCVFHVRYIQTFHMDSKGFFDIGYNFLVGGDGLAYEGRGWDVEGAHVFGYNSRSIGIAFIGTFIRFNAPDRQILACKRLIQMGVDLGYIRKDYKLLTARQFSGTESPGAALFEDIKTWPHFVREP